MGGWRGTCLLQPEFVVLIGYTCIRRTRKPISGWLHEAAHAGVQKEQAPPVCFCASSSNILAHSSTLSTVDMAEYDPLTTTMPQEDCVADSSRAKDAHVAAADTLESLKTSERMIKAIKRGIRDQVVLPEPEYRRVAGNVTRRTNRAVAPLPPPNPRQPQSAFHSRVTSRGRRKGAAGFESDSDGDSDRENPKRKSGDNDLGAATQKKKRPEPQSGPDDLLSSRMEIEREEKERVQQMITLRKIQDISQDILAHRHGIQKDVTYIRQSLFNQRASSYESPLIHRTVIDRDAKLHEYLDEMLYGAIKDISSAGKGSTELSNIEEIVQKIEGTVLMRFMMYDDWRFDFGKSLDERLIMALRKAEKALWRWDPFITHYTNMLRGQGYMTADSYYHGPGRDPSVQQVPIENHRQNIKWVVQEFIRINCEDPWKGKKRFIHAVADAYLERIIEAMCRAAMTMPPPPGLEPSGCQLGIIESSRENRRLKPEYIAWVTAGVDPVKLGNFETNWHRLKRKELLRDYRKNMDSVKITVVQEFCPDLVSPGVVSLLLAKGGYPTGIRDVSAEELESLGWVAGRGEGSRVYWRCEPANEDADEIPMDLLKVGMDGEILGAFCMDSRGNWGLIEPTEEGYRVRALRKSERKAICLE